MFDGGHWLLGFYDVLALRYLGKKVGHLRTLFTLLTVAFGHNFGIATLTAGAVRYRLHQQPASTLPMWLPSCWLSGMVTSAIA